MQVLAMVRTPCFPRAADAHPQSQVRPFERTANSLVSVCQ
jgi:hypothetical protein